MRIVLLGAPGAGKGTQCKHIVAGYGLLHLSSGDILRRERRAASDLGRKAQSYMDAGQLVPDELIVAMVMNELKVSDGSGFLLDGFPRTLGQAKELDRALHEAGTSVAVVLNLEVDDDKLEDRITGRRSCPACGGAYHVLFNPPRTQGKCDKGCGELTQRPDDTSAVVRERIKTYHEQTAPLVAYYQQQGNAKCADGNRQIEQVTKALFELLDAVPQNA